MGFLTWKFELLRLAGLLMSTPLSTDPDALAARRAAFTKATRPGWLMGQPAAMQDVKDSEVAGVRVRRYTPNEARPGTLVFIHGGGFVIGGLDSHDVLARALAAGTHRRVVSVDYRLAPEHPYPAAVDDCLAVTRAVAAEPDAGSLALCGDSAGGNLAAVVANVCAEDSGGARLIAQALIYPATDSSKESPSYETYRDGFLTRERARWYKEQYTPDPARRTEPAASPLLAPLATLRRAPPAYLCLAQCDLLFDEGEAYAGRLREAGVPVQVDVTPGVPHAFASMLGLAEGRAAVDRVSAWLTKQWGD